MSILDRIVIFRKAYYADGSRLSAKSCTFQREKIESLDPADNRSIVGPCNDRPPCKNNRITKTYSPQLRRKYKEENI